MQLKPGVRITGIRPEIVLALMTAESLFEKRNTPLVVTAALDGKHQIGSLHYSGAAVDLRTKHLPSQQSTSLLADELRGALGPDFDVVVEEDHLHVEFQPKIGGAA